MIFKAISVFVGCVVALPTLVSCYVTTNYLGRATVYRLGRATSGLSRPFTTEQQHPWLRHRLGKGQPVLALRADGIISRRKRSTLVSFASTSVIFNRNLLTLFLSASVDSGEGEDTTAEEESFGSDEIDGKATSIKNKLEKIVSYTDRGFKATAIQRQQIKNLIDELQLINPNKEPLKDYYDKSARDDDGPEDRSSLDKGTTLVGKWTLIYTDAPDITSLRGSPLLSELGRIGQECRPPYIKNVIEWKQPKWSRGVALLSGMTDDGTSDDSMNNGTPSGVPRIIQKVLTEGTASADRPTVMNLKVAGIEIVTDDDDENDYYDDDSDSKGLNAASERLKESIRRKGLVAGIVQRNPLQLVGSGPFQPPFGQFEVLYLDDDLRIVRTYQNYIAINQRWRSEQDTWF